MKNYSENAAAYKPSRFVVRALDRSMYVDYDMLFAVRACSISGKSAAGLSCHGCAAVR